jgi:iron(III) transport system ATP-binding protein
MTSLVLSGLHKSFGPQPVLCGLDLEVPDASLTAVLGRSGSGKTTLLRILAGFERLDQGTVTLGGQVVESPGTHVAPERRRIGYVPQDGALFPHLSVAANIGFSLSRRARHKGRIDELLELVGLSGYGRRYPHQLSGGQQQRVALARALASKPRLVLLDEPFSSLDATMRAEVRADVQRVLRDAGTTAVLVTHDQDEALSLADQVAVLRDGRVAQCATPEELYTRPLDPGLASFVGDVNLLEGVVEDGKAVTCLGALAVSEEGPPLREADRILAALRPEQIEVHVGHDGDGIEGRVVESQYYGHDTVITIETVMHGETVPIRARLAGRAPIALGASVMIAVAGPVRTWSAEPTQSLSALRLPDTDEHAHDRTTGSSGR